MRVGARDETIRDRRDSMRRATAVCAAAILALCVLTATAFSQGEKRDRVQYEKYYRDPVLEEMAERADSLEAIRDSITAEIEKKWRMIEEQDSKDRRVIRFDFDGVEKPGSPKDFNAPFHFPPVAQHYTSTCWSFGTTSFLESEIKRLSGKETKLSELYTAYWEFVEKARGFVHKRGHQEFPSGSESDAVLIIWRKYGIVPAEAYTGLIEGEKRHDHRAMTREMRRYLEHCREHAYWDEEQVVAHIRTILDAHIGRPPEEFVYKGEKTTPLRFLEEVVNLELNDYVQVMSTSSKPFNEFGEFEVSDNWRPTDTYYNVPLELFYAGIKKATEMGHTVCIGGDVSEPGYNGFEDAAIVPTFDIPPLYIDQDSREFRFYNRTTEDDHGVHLLAHKVVGGRDWYLIKDSARSARHGAHEGYYFYRDDYIKLKMLTYMIHRDVAQEAFGGF
jgi:bleomycin hydrolase